MYLHAIMRRTPNELARHSKRLGHVLGNPGPAHLVLAAYTTSSGEDMQTTSSLTKALTIEPITTSSVSEQQTVHPTTQATSTPHVSSSPSSSMSSTASATKILPTSVVTPTPLPSSTSPASRLSGGAIAGIAVASIIVGALLAFYGWKIYLRYRDRQQASLSTQYAFSGPEGHRESTVHPRGSEVRENPAGSRDDAQRASTISPFEARGQSVYLASAGIMGSQPSTPSSHVSYAVPAPPPASYNNPNTLAALAAAGPGTSLNTAGPPGIQPVATIKCSFVPTLPDELSISTGERVRVISQFDDGWALCENGGGEQGMVPQECLDHITVDPDDPDWRNARRVSSLYPDARRS